MNKNLSLIGIAKKAGRLAVGTDAACEAVRVGRAKLIIIASDAADNTVRRVNARHAEVPVHRLSASREELGGAVGFASCSALAICDAGLARAFLKASNVPPVKKPGGNSNKKPINKTKKSI